MSVPTEERRPRQGAATILNSTPDSSDLAVRAASTGYVIRAVMTMTNGRTRVQHFASLHSAVRAQERAEDRGCECVLSLCRVTPVGVISADPDEIGVGRG